MVKSFGQGRVRPLFVAATLSIMATTGAAAQGASVGNVIQAFQDAVYLYCTANIVDGSLLRDLNFDGTSGLELASPQRAERAFKQGASSVMVVKGVGEIVLLEEYPDGACKVSAYGPPAETTLDLVGAALTGVSFKQAEQQDEPKARTFRRRYVRTVDGVEYQVLLSGNDPGAPGTISRFSTLLATVKRVTPAQK